MDKPATEIARERPVPITKVAATSARIPKAARTKRSSATRTSGRRTDAGPDLHGVRLTSPDRIVYKSQGLTKRDLADYYAAIADDILPHVAGRALSLVRCPGGSSAKCFYQKHRAKGMSDAIGTVRVRGKTKMDEYLTIHDARGLVELVQFGTLEFHPGGSRADDYERPDRLTFDLDPDTSLPWRDVAKAAAQVRDLLKELGLESFVKTTGGKGLHVVVPIKPDLKWPEAKAFSRVVAETLCARNPGQYTASIAKKARKGRIFIDYLRNERGSTSIAPYSTRASADAPVATPLTWAELAKGIDPADFNVKTLPGRLRRQKKDPWERFFKLRQAVPRATQAQRRAR